MSTLLDSLLKRALPKPRDTTPTEFRGFVVPKYWIDAYAEELDRAASELGRPRDWIVVG